MLARDLRIAVLGGALCCAAGGALAQDADAKPHVPLQKTIGVVTPTGPVPSLFVVNSAGAKLEGGKLTMTGVSANSIVFADRPVRAAGHVTTEQFIMQWDEGADNFIKDPPNATISVLGGDGSKVEDAVVTLRSPKLEAGNLTFEVSVLEGNLSGSSGAAALFIDRGGGGHGGGGFGGFGGGGFGGRDFGGDRFGGDYARSDDRLDLDRFDDFDRYRNHYWHAPYYHGAWYAAGAPDFGWGAAAGWAAARPWRYSYDTCGYYPYPPCY
jgi:hypothetical protein